jgi:acetyl-CoA C-acetyltransferase
VAEAYIIDAVRTAVGKRRGALADVHSADLAAHPIAALFDRTGVDPGAVDDVILGCCDTIGSQAGDIARTAWLAAGLPDHVPGVTIDRQCGRRGRRSDAPRGRRSGRLRARPGACRRRCARRR